MNLKNCFVNLNIAEAKTLPPEVFTAQEFLDLEEKNIFGDAWLAAPQVDAKALEIPGSRVPFELLDHKLCAVRECHGLGLRCFSNICTHQGNLLVDKPEVGHDIFICGVHGRAFSLEGKCISHWPDWDPCPADNLKEYNIRWTEIFPMVNFSQNPNSFNSADFVADILTVLPLKKAEVADLKKKERILDWNWKLNVRNYLDHTHIPLIHSKSLMPKIEFGSYRTDACGNFAIQAVLPKNPKFRLDFENCLPEIREQFAIWIFIWPNLALNIYPFGLSINIWEPVKNNPSKTMMRWSCYVWDKEKYELADEIWGLSQVDEEDIEYIARMQKGMESGQLSRTAFSPKNELVTHWFERKVYENIFLKK